MRKIFLFSLLLLLPLFLSGCGNDKSNQVTDKTGEEKTAKQPAAQKIQEPAYDFCQTQGYELIVRFDKETQGSKALCRFPDTSECPALDFMEGRCSLIKGSEIYQPPAAYDKYAACPQIYEPVCTATGITFSNECVALKQEAVIIHAGACPETVSAGANYPSAVKAEETADAQKTAVSAPDWLAVLTALITSAPASQPPAFVEKCVYGTNVVYFQSSGCDDCYSTLYNENGEVICFPNNDAIGGCPSYFDRNNRAYYCDRVWIDNR